MSLTVFQTSAVIDKRKPETTLGCSKHDVIVAQYRETAGSVQLYGFHLLATSSEGFTNAPVKWFGQDGGFTTASSMLASLISHVKKVNAASCSDLPIWPLIAPSQRRIRPLERGSQPFRRGTRWHGGRRICCNAPSRGRPSTRPSVNRASWRCRWSHQAQGSAKRCSALTTPASWHSVLIGTSTQAHHQSDLGSSSPEGPQLASRVSAPPARRGSPRAASGCPGREGYPETCRGTEESVRSKRKSRHWTKRDSHVKSTTRSPARHRR